MRRNVLRLQAPAERGEAPIRPPLACPHPIPDEPLPEYPALPLATRRLPAPPGQAAPWLRRLVPGAPLSGGCGRLEGAARLGLGRLGGGAGQCWAAGSGMAAAAAAGRRGPGAGAGRGAPGAAALRALTPSSLLLLPAEAETRQRLLRTAKKEVGRRRGRWGAPCLRASFRGLASSPEPSGVVRGEGGAWGS